MSKTITILIADDHPIFRRGLRDVVKEDASVQLIGEAGDGAEALRLIEELKPQVAVLDHDMPKLNGLQVAQAVRRQKSTTGLVMLTMFKEERLFNEAMDAGFLGYVLKENAASDLIECIHAVAAGRAFISPVLSPFLLQRGARATALVQSKPGLEKLTPLSGEFSDSLPRTSRARKSPSNSASAFTPWKIIARTSAPSWA